MYKVHDVAGRFNTERMVTIATDCSGMEAPVQALENVLKPHNIEINQLHACDSNKACEQLSDEKFHPLIYWRNLRGRNNNGGFVVSPQLYVAGPPCQPFADGGKHGDVLDSKNGGDLFFECIRFIKEAGPKAFILENVAGITKGGHRATFEAVLEALTTMGTHNVSWKKVDVCLWGIPQHRERVYIVGVRKDIDQRTFSFANIQPTECLTSKICFLLPMVVVGSFHIVGEMHYFKLTFE